MIKKIISATQIAHKIHLFRGQRVMLDFDLAALYGVTTKVLNQAVKRNAARFPDDFMFRSSSDEIATVSQIVTPLRGRKRSRSQIVTLKRGQNLKYLPHAITEQGVAMLSSVLRSERAVKVNIAIMRAFVQLREALETNRALAQKFSELEQRVGKHDDEIAAIIDAIRQLIAPPGKPRREIGFHARETSPRYGVRSRR